MKKHSYIVCYDIKFLEVKDKKAQKRLRQVVKYLESVSFRIQKSVFFFQSISKEMLLRVVQKLEELIDKDLDDVRVYKLKGKSYALGQGVDLASIFILK